MSEDTKNSIENRIDIIEDDILRLDDSILKILLKDRTTHKNILWATKDYESYGYAFKEKEQIKVELITGSYSRVIQPRAAKTKEIQEQRIRDKAEVFTPSWVCNEQNNQIDEMWFGRKNVFNEPHGISWLATKEKIEFFDSKKDWKAYINAKRLEITCGEAPYLVSRYDTTTGELIPILDRIGLFDRKMRIVCERCETKEEWISWSLRALKSVYGYEFQGDSVLIARENVFYDYLDYYRYFFNEEPDLDLLQEVANIISWNIWQMDGLKCVVPYSCHLKPEEYHQISMFDDTQEEKCVKCPGCEKNNIFKHNGTYCRIYDWTGLNKSISFLDVFL